MFAIVTVLLDRQTMMQPCEVASGCAVTQDDGKCVAALMPAETPEAQQAQNHVIFLLNFADELQRKLPAGK
ncbi:MAG: hypothetical protein ABSG41_09545 [Bryobacteraceae bacterium]